MAGELADRAAVVIRSRLLSNVVSTMSGLVLIWLVTRDQLAVLSIVLMFYEVGREVSMMGMADGLLYFFPITGAGGQRRVTGHSATAIFGIALIVAGVYLAAAATTASWLPEWTTATRDEVSTVLPWLALVALVEFPSHVTINALIASGHARQAGRYQIASTVLAFGAIVGPLAVGGGPIDVVRALVLYACLRAGLAAFLLRTWLPRGGEVKKEVSLREQLDFSVPLGFQTLTGRISKFVDRFVVATLLTEGASASLNVAAQQIPFLKPFVFGMGAALIPLLVELRLEKHTGELLRVWRKSIAKVSLFVVPVTVFATVMAHELVPAIVGERYVDAVLPFRIFCVASMFRVAHFGAVLQAYADTRYSLRITVVTTLFNLVVSVPLTVAMGISGAALGTALSYVLGFYLAVRRIRTLAGAGWAACFPFPEFARSCVVSVASTLVPLLTAGWLEATGMEVGPRLGLHALTFAALYAGLGVASRTIVREDWGYLRRLVAS